MYVPEPYVSQHVLPIQAALLQKLKSQVGSEKMFNLMMNLLKPEAPGPETGRSSGPPESGMGAPPFQNEMAATTSRLGFMYYVLYATGNCSLFISEGM